MSEENRKTLVNFIETVWNQGDLGAVDQYIGDSYTIHNDPGDPWDKQTLTPDGFRERVQISRAPVPDQAFEILENLPGQDKVIITWNWRGKHVGDIAGHTATGKELHMSGATVYYFEQGKITGHWQIADRLGIFQQLMANSSEAGA